MIIIQVHNEMHFSVDMLNPEFCGNNMSELMLFLYF